MNKVRENNKPVPVHKKSHSGENVNKIKTFKENIRNLPMGESKDAVSTSRINTNQMENAGVKTRMTIGPKYENLKTGVWGDLGKVELGNNKNGEGGSKLSRSGLKITGQDGGGADKTK